MTKVNICWLGRKHDGKFVCFIPFTIDGVGKTVDKALINLEQESIKIIKALKHKSVKCNFTVNMIKKFVNREMWWKKKKTLRGNPKLRRNR